MVVGANYVRMLARDAALGGDGTWASPATGGAYTYKGPEGDRPPAEAEAHAAWDFFFFLKQRLGSRRGTPEGRRARRASIRRIHIGEKYYRNNHSNIGGNWGEYAQYWGELGSEEGGTAAVPGRKRLPIGECGGSPQYKGP